MSVVSPGRQTKWNSRRSLPLTRPDWDGVRVPVMRWCLWVKLAQHYEAFGALLHGTGERPIVELIGAARGRRDKTASFWGAVEDDGDRRIARGLNVLGQLLMQLREELRARGPAMRRVEPPEDVPNFMLYGRPIGPVEG